MDKNVVRAMADSFDAIANLGGLANLDATMLGTVTAAGAVATHLRMLADDGNVSDFLSALYVMETREFSSGTSAAFRNAYRATAENARSAFFDMLRRIDADEALGAIAALGRLAEAAI